MLRCMSPLLADSVEKGGSCGAAGSVIQSVYAAGLKIMMGHRQVEQAALFYEFSLEKHVPGDHLLCGGVAKCASGLRKRS
jgi:hypothetical protein